MRVLMTADTVGGVWTYSMELARALGARGVEVALATMGLPPSEAQRTEAASIPSVTIHESGYRLEWMDEPWGDVERAGEWLLGLERAVRPDIVHLNGYAHAALDWPVPVVVVAHSCVLSWWDAVRQEPAPPSWDRYRDMVACGLHAADLVVSPTRALLEAMTGHYGAPPHTRIIPNGRDPGRFAPAEKVPIIFTAGRLWDAGKNVAAVCDAAAAVTWPVYVAGDTRGPGGGEHPIVAAQALGRLDEAALAEWLGRASIYALPARYEPFGLSVLEAALARCALVLGDLPSLRENWDSAALFVDPEDPEALVWALDRLADAPALREALAGEAHVRARRLTPARMAAEYLDAYESVGAQAAPPGQAALAAPGAERTGPGEVACAS